MLVRGESTMLGLQRALPTVEPELAHQMRSEEKYKIGSFPIFTNNSQHTQIGKIAVFDQNGFRL